MSANKKKELNMSTEQSGFLDDIEHFKKKKPTNY